VDVGQARPTRLPRRRRAYRSLGGGIEIADQAKVYAEHLVKVYGLAHVPFVVWEKAKSRQGHAREAWRALASALRDLGVQHWTTRHIDPDDLCHEILDDERFDEVRLEEGVAA
jgi:hypothetical protein